MKYEYPAATAAALRAAFIGPPTDEDVARFLGLDRENELLKDLLCRVGFHALHLVATWTDEQREQAAVWCDAFVLDRLHEMACPEHLKATHKYEIAGYRFEVTTEPGTTDDELRDLIVEQINKAPGLRARKTGMAIHIEQDPPSIYSFVIGGHPVTYHASADSLAADGFVPDGWTPPPSVFRPVNRKQRRSRQSARRAV